MSDVINIVVSLTFAKLLNLLLGLHNNTGSDHAMLSLKVSTWGYRWEFEPGVERSEDGGGQYFETGSHSQMTLPHCDFLPHGLQLPRRQGYLERDKQALTLFARWVREANLAYIPILQG